MPGAVIFAPEYDGVKASGQGAQVIGGKIQRVLDGAARRRGDRQGIIHGGRPQGEDRAINALDRGGPAVEVDLVRFDGDGPVNRRRPGEGHAGSAGYGQAAAALDNHGAAEHQVAGSGDGQVAVHGKTRGEGDIVR